MTTQPRTLTELRLRHAQLTDTAQRLRDQGAAADPTRASTAALMRNVRRTQLRADDYASVLRLLEAPSLERMEAHLTGALGAVQETSGVEITDAAVAEVLFVVRSLFKNWRSQR